MTKISRCIAGFFLLMAACNSRPPYFKRVYEFTTDCDGGAKALLECDPDPEVQTALRLDKADDDDKIESIGCSSYSLMVTLRSKTRCTGGFSQQLRDVPCTLVGRPLECTATWRLLEYRKPTIDPDKEPLPEINEESSNL